MSIPKPSEILQRLIQYNTTNPPGHERACIEYLESLLVQAGLIPLTLAQDPERPNLLVRIPGEGKAPGLMLFGHVDVVTTAGQAWSVPPFDGLIRDGVLWGRGALDMKAGIAMITSAVLTLHASGHRPAGDVLFLALSDEEAGGKLGARYVAESHAEQFAGVKYALGEFGGFPLYVDGRPLYMIQLGEKQPCWIEATLRGPGGHGARPMRDGAMAALGRLLSELNGIRLPVHITPITERMVIAMANALPQPKRTLFKHLLRPRLTDALLRRLGETGKNLEPLFRNTVNATIVRGGEKANVIPSEITVGLDARLLPGYGPEDLFDELNHVLSDSVDFDVCLYDQSESTPDFGLFPLLKDSLARAHPGSCQVPYLLPGSSDARFFSRLGVQTYGYLPMNLPPGFRFFDMIHASDERIPIDCLDFGVRVLTDVLRRYGEA